ncbi:MAG: hypothetical protein ACQEWV_22305 [Bacillota bacterium]
MFEISQLLIMAFAGGIIAIIGFVVILGRRVSEPKRELKQRIDSLEEEVKKLKNGK